MGTMEIKTNKIHSNRLVSEKKLITHDGSFHADDIFACATLSIFLEKKGECFKIIRTRDPKIIEEGDYVFDVGGIYNPKINRFDHHQKDFKEKRSNGIMYSSFGLIWKKFGLNLATSKKVAQLIETRLVVPIDAFDNGLDLVENKNKFSPYFIQHFFLSMRPTWTEKEVDNNAMFLRSVNFAKEILDREIIQARDAVLAEEKVVSLYKNTKDKKVIILDENYPYEYVLNNFPEPLFVIYQRISDGFWGAKSVRKDLKSFKNRKDFPKSWAGLKDQELQKKTGVSDAVFCHRGLFLVVAKSKEGAIKLAKLALKI